MLVNRGWHKDTRKHMFLWNIFRARSWFNEWQRRDGLSTWGAWTGKTEKESKIAGLPCCGCFKINSYNRCDSTKGLQNKFRSFIIIRISFSGRKSAWLHCGHRSNERRRLGVGAKRRPDGLHEPQPSQVRFPAVTIVLRSDFFLGIFLRIVLILALFRRRFSALQFWKHNVPVHTVHSTRLAGQKSFM